MKRKKKIMNDVFENHLLKGIFHYIYLTGAEFPWDINAVSSVSLDTLYFGNYSGKKYISPLVEGMIDNNTRFLSETNLTVLAQVIINLYLDNWKRLYNAFTIEYNPIENTDAYITRNEGHKTSDNTETSNSLVHGETVSTNATNNGSVKTGIYGFNSSDSSPSNDSDTEQTGSGTETHSGTDETTVNDKHNGTHDIDYSEHRHGNIGVTTNVYMLNEELEFRKKVFFEQVFETIDNVLCLEVY